MAKMKVVLEMEVNEEKMDQFNVNPEELKAKIIAYEDDTVDGFVLTRKPILVNSEDGEEDCLIKCCNCSEIFFQDVRILSKEWI